MSFDVLVVYIFVRGAGDYLLVYFFDGEEVIRDVSGIQSCGLPILYRRRNPYGRPCRRRNTRNTGSPIQQRKRKEERGIGEECRYRWGGYKNKKKKRTKRIEHTNERGR